MHRPVTSLPSPLALEVARGILDGFDAHYSTFRALSASARGRFERADWRGSHEASLQRIQSYDLQVREAAARLTRDFPATRDEALWPSLKLAYISLLYEHLQPECAETFFNSVATRLLDRRYYRNDHIFWRPAVSTEHLVGAQPAYRCAYDTGGGLRGALRELLLGYGLDNPWQDLERDLDCAERVVRQHFPAGFRVLPDFHLQALSSLFFRNKAAYVVGRARNGARDFPFVVPILQDAHGALYLDALLLSPAHVGAVFSLARSYFMVDMEVPSAFVDFLSSVLPSKPKAELYTVLGLQKQGKTLFYRDLHQHLLHSTDRFTLAAGTKGMVMVVFTLPSFPYVFKVIRDRMDPPKDVDRAEVMQKYVLVKNHDRAGRLADTLEYSDVAFPLARMEPRLVEELEALAPSMLERDGDRLVVRHLYIERRMVPLDVYLETADGPQARAAIRDYGNALRELAGANIFAGDLLPKNFGVTRYGRVVFYDYDELGYLTDYSFRPLPGGRSGHGGDDDDDGGMGSSEASFAVGPHDVFPEQFIGFLFRNPEHRRTFEELNGDLLTPRFWTEWQERVGRGEVADLFPYPQWARFSPTGR